MKFDPATGNTSTPLIRPIFFISNPLLTALTGFHCIHVCTTQYSQWIKELDWQFEGPESKP